ncbi:MAG: 50S ribosomal protein L15 [Candidatus Cloacimonas sp. 4484_275]|jgi:large subunit ribosomal protein L15|nr:MAG: 50S ribosomal protein L15 [Candidatus Cloacimonas sp. 4484_275]
MELHNIKRPRIKKHKKRLGKGQGTGQGGTAGKGHKGQKARSGGNIPAWFEGGQMPLQRRVPKRGFTNIFKKQYRIVNLKQLLAFEDEEFDIEKFEALNLIRKAKAREKAPVKVLAKGAEEFNKKVKIKANAFSKTAKEIIEKNGGSVEVI